MTACRAFTSWMRSLLVSVDYPVQPVGRPEDCASTVKDCSSTLPVNHHDAALADILNKSVEICRSIARRTHRLLNNLDCYKEPGVLDEFSALRDVVLQTTRTAVIIGELTQNQSERLVHEIIATSQRSQISAESFGEWAQKLKTLNLLLRRIQLHITMSHRIKEHAHVFPAGSREFSREELDQLKELNEKMLYAQIALGESHVEAIGTRLNLDPTSVCNIRCVTCYQNYSESFEPYVITPNALEKALTALPFVKGLDIFGAGEPTLSKQIASICDHVGRSGVSANLLTNGTLLNRRDMPLDKLHSVTISWDGGVAETVEQIRLGVSYERTLENIREIRERAPQLNLAFNVTVNRANIDELAQIVELAGSLGLKKVNMTRMYGPPHLQALTLTTDDLARFEAELSRARQVGIEHGVEVSSVVHYEGLVAASEPIKKQELLHHFATRPAVERKSNETLPSLYGQMTAFVDMELPFTLPAWCESLPSSDSSPFEFEFSIPALRSKVEAKLQQVVNTPNEQLNVPFCMSPWAHNFVTASGGLRPCCVIDEDYGDLTKPGSLLQHLNSDQLTSLRSGLLGKTQLASACRGCTFVERYHSLPEYFSFLESLGKNPEDLRFPSQYEPPSYIKIRPRNALLQIRETTWRRIQLETGESLGHNLFENLVRSQRIEPSDVAFMRPNGSFYRATWMAEASTTPTIGFIFGNSSGLREQGQGLVQALWRRVREVAPCLVLHAFLQETAPGVLVGRVDFTNSSTDWLWGAGTRPDASDAVGLRFINSHGHQASEARLYFPNECVPPGATRAAFGTIQWCGPILTSGSFEVEVDIVRELVNWSRPQESRLRIRWGAGAHTPQSSDAGARP